MPDDWFFKDPPEDIPDQDSVTVENDADSSSTIQKQLDYLAHIQSQINQGKSTTLKWQWEQKVLEHHLDPAVAKCIETVLENQETRAKECLDQIMLRMRDFYRAHGRKPSRAYLSHDFYHAIRANGQQPYLSYKGPETFLFGMKVFLVTSENRHLHVC